MPKKIQIKDVDVLRALLNRRIDDNLLVIIFWIAQEYGLCFTEGWREALRPGDVHDTDPLRATDLRYWFYRPTVAKEIELAINERYEYDYKRPEKNCAWIHESFNEDGTSRGVHFHIQVHPNTRRRESPSYGGVL